MVGYSPWGLTESDMIEHTPNNNSLTKKVKDLYNENYNLGTIQEPKRLKIKIYNRDIKSDIAIYDV